MTKITIERETLERAIEAMKAGRIYSREADALRAALAAQPAEAQQEPVAWRHSETGQLYDSEEEVPLADGDEWAEPLYATPATQQAPAAWRQWSTKLHDWDYQTNRGDLRPDTPADPLFVAAAQPVPLTDEQIDAISMGLFGCINAAYRKQITDSMIAAAGEKT